MCDAMCKKCNKIKPNKCDKDKIDLTELDERQAWIKNINSKSSKKLLESHKKTKLRSYSKKSAKRQTENVDESKPANVKPLDSDITAMLANSTLRETNENPPGNLSPKDDFNFLEPISVPNDKPDLSQTVNEINDIAEELKSLAKPKEQPLNQFNSTTIDTNAIMSDWTLLPDDSQMPPPIRATKNVNNQEEPSNNGLPARFRNKCVVEVFMLEEDMNKFMQNGQILSSNRKLYFTGFK